MISEYGYKRHKEKARKRQADQTASGRDIGIIPKVSCPSRRGRCRNSLLRFLKVYFPVIFYLAWSPNHIRIIKKLERAIKHGGKFALAMPRGSGKTWISVLGALWAIAYGYRKYIVFVSATDDLATSNMLKIKMSIETNDKFKADFPEICYPVAKLEGIANRCKGQTHGGKRTYIEWNDSRLVMPRIEGSKCSGSIFESASITCGNLRGKSYMTAEGISLRPDFAIPDDVQTKESALSPTQCVKRMEIIDGDIMNMNAPGTKMAAVMPCTVIEKGDMADFMLDRKLRPDWNGERLKLLDAFPTNMDLWDRYREIWGQSQRDHDGSIIDATAFYEEHRKEMDAGAIPTWPQRKEQDEISGIQYAMNQFIENRKVFFSEYQNSPESKQDETKQLTKDALILKLNNLPRLTVPLACSSVVMFIDVHDKLLYWEICAFGEGFSGSIIDYGTWPKQKTKEFSMNEARYTMETEYKDMGRSARIYAALSDLTTMALGREYIREDGSVLNIARCHIDANWGPETPVVYQFCRQSVYSNILTPCHGRGILANQKPISERKRERHEKMGLEWYISSNKQKRTVRFCVYDTNFWKTATLQRLITSEGDPGCLSIFGTDPYQHNLLFMHLCAEYFTPTSGQGRRVDVWKTRAGRPDNHWFDALVGCLVAASIDGITLNETKPIAKKPRRVVNLPAYIPQM